MMFDVISHKALIYIASIERLIGYIDKTIFKANISPNPLLFLQERTIEKINVIKNLCNINIHLQEIKKIVRGQKANDNEITQLILNLKNVFDYLEKNPANAFSMHLINHIIKLIQIGLLEDWHIGLIRTGFETDYSIYKKFEPANQVYQFSNNLTYHLAEHITFINNDKYHPIVRATVWLNFINTTSPFLGLNNIFSLITFEYFLTSMGYSTKMNIPILKLFEFSNIKNSTDLINLCQKSNQELIEKICEGLYKLLDYAYQKIIKINNLDQARIYLHLNERQKEIIDYLRKNHQVTKKEYSKLFKVSSMTAYRDLNKLVELGILQRKGEHKLTKYIFS